MSDNINTIDSKDLIVLDDRLGSGAFSDVFAGQYKQSSDNGASQAVAVKKIYHENSSIWEAINEYKIQHQLSADPSIVRVIGIIHYPKYYSALILERALWGLDDMLTQRIEKLSKDEFISFARQAIQAIDWVHRHAILHRDIKSGSFFVFHKNNIKLGDFGLAISKLDAAKDKKRSGTLEWMAPEVLCHHGASESSDMYSFGVMIWELISSNSSPYQQLKCTYPSIWKSMIAKRVPLGLLRPSVKDIQATTPLWLMRVMQSLWESDSAKRPKASELLEQFRTSQESKPSSSIFSSHTMFATPGPVGSPKTRRSRSPCQLFAPRKHCHATRVICNSNKDTGHPYQGYRVRGASHNKH